MCTVIIPSITIRMALHHAPRCRAFGHNTRRMAETAAHLAEHVFPRLAVRQWVLSLKVEDRRSGPPEEVGISFGASVPKRLRYFLQRDGAALNTALRIFLRVVQQGLRWDEAVPVAGRPHKSR